MDRIHVLCFVWIWMYIGYGFTLGSNSSQTKTFTPLSDNLYIHRQKREVEDYGKLASFILAETLKIITIGVFIDKYRVLTSYNPFRHLMKSNLLQKIVVCYDIKVQLNYTRTWLILGFSKIACGRPVVPMADNELSEDQWHDPYKSHSPLHDLLIVRLGARLDPDYAFKIFKIPLKLHIEVLDFGPLSITPFAKEHDKLRNDIKFMTAIKSVGKNDTTTYRLLMDEDGEEVDCNEWLSRKWGYFICISNDEDKDDNFASGSLLFSNGNLFGVGSFTLWRGKESILVFTDIRPYREHLENTCLDRDSIRHIVHNKIQ